MNRRNQWAGALLVAGVALAFMAPLRAWAGQPAKPAHGKAKKNGRDTDESSKPSHPPRNA